MVEQLVEAQRVGGSSPSSSTILSRLLSCATEQCERGAIGGSLGL